MKKKLTIETNPSGFTVWTEEMVDGKLTRHWVVDGSQLLIDGEIRLGMMTQYKHRAYFDGLENAIKIVTK